MFCLGFEATSIFWADFKERSSINAGFLLGILSKKTVLGISHNRPITVRRFKKMYVNPKFHVGKGIGPTMAA
jgi:hypothetical protein